MLRLICSFGFQEGNKDSFSSPNSALTPPLATLGKKPPLPYCPWKEGQAFGSGHSLHSSSRLCLASTGRPLIGDSWDETIVSVVVWWWPVLQNKSRLYLIAKYLAILQHYREREYFTFKWHKLAAEEVWVFGSSKMGLESCRSSLSKYTQAQMIFKGFACLYLPCCSTRPLSMTPCSLGSDP